jgi:hypothetical protein
MCLASQDSAQTKAGLALLKELTLSDAASKEIWTLSLSLWLEVRGIKPTLLIQEDLGELFKFYSDGVVQSEPVDDLDEDAAFFRLDNI